MPLQRPEKNALSFLLECEPGKIVVNKKVLPITAYGGSFMIDCRHLKLSL